jgi:hypothetical protein
VKEEDIPGLVARVARVREYLSYIYDRQKRESIFQTCE